MINSVLRFIIQIFFNGIYHVIQVEQSIVRKKIRSAWNRIPVPDHGAESYEAQKERIEKSYSTLKGNKWWVLTSGTSNEPKKIPYNEERIKDLNKDFLKSMIVLTGDFKGTKTFFAFGSLDSDQSLTSRMVDETEKPSYLELLQAPYRFLTTAEGKNLRMQYGDLTARTIVLIVTKPRFIYATNPSTLTHFIDELQRNWPDIQSNIKKMLDAPESLKGVLRLQDGDGIKSLREAASKDFKISILFSSLKAVITWDGGYVRIFLDRLMKLLPDRVQHLPMYSMSTETIETLPHKINGKISFLPTMKNTLPEFLTEEGKILKANELQINASYTLLITNKWGLERYDTQDIFKVEAIIDHLPSLKFVRRRNVTASITGEKITEAQAILLSGMLKERYPELIPTSLSLFPIFDKNSVGYQMAIIGITLNNASEVSRDADALLGQINSEYKDKVRSGRLLPLHLKTMSVKELAALMGQETRWESQFKVMPLYEKPVTTNS